MKQARYNSALVPALALGLLAGLAVPAARAQVAAAGSAQDAAQNAAQSGPVAPIQALYAALTRIEAENGAPFARRTAELGPVVDRVFDLPVVLQNSLGLRYRTIPDAQKKQLLDQFRQFTVARYVSNFKPGGGDRFTVDPTPVTAPIPGEQIVHTKIGAGDGSTEVDYVMRQGTAGWQVVDVLLNGNISQVAVQRADFSSSLSSGDATALIDSLKRKTRTFSEG